MLERFQRDLARRGIEFDPPSDPLHEEPFVELLTATYVTAPSVFDS